MSSGPQVVCSFTSVERRRWKKTAPPTSTTAAPTATESGLVVVDGKSEDSELIREHTMVECESRTKFFSFD